MSESTQVVDQVRARLMICIVELSDAKSEKLKVKSKSKKVKVGARLMIYIVELSNGEFTQSVTS